MAETQLRTALIVAVPEAAAMVDAWRERTSSAKPSSGMPPHVTILFPFVPPGSIDDSLIENLRALFGTFESSRSSSEQPAGSRRCSTSHRIQRSPSCA